MHLLDKRSTRALPVAAMIHDNSTDRTALVPATHHSNFCPINFRCRRANYPILTRGVKKLVVGLWVGSAGPPSGVHRFTRPFCRRCAPGLNWPGRASGAVTLKKLECSKQAYALYTLARLWVGSAGPPSGVHRFTRPFCRRCAPGLNWPGRASGAVTLKKLECSKQAYALRTTAKAFAKDVFINQERKLGARRRSDTVLVSTINDADQGSADVAFRTPLAPYEKSKFLGSGGSMVARLKLKGIDGRAPPGVEPAA
ncbi:hypothetical protein L1887_41284 [Cichorium endivia]|nr:hypothetical protein L1887_41284 [Cichorium endivia]